MILRRTGGRIFKNSLKLQATSFKLESVTETKILNKVHKA
jgi:hypothetical protein